MEGFPPLAPLRRLLVRLETAHVEAALGGSGLLSACGLATGARDWDLTTDAPLDRVLGILDDTPHQLVGSSGVHADHKLTLEDGAIELIVGFAMHGERGVVRLPTLVTTRWNEIPVGSPEVWAVAYAMMGRPAKAETLFAWLDRRGASRKAIDVLSQEPLPADLEARLAKLPLTTTH